MCPAHDKIVIILNDLFVCTRADSSQNVGGSTNIYSQSSNIFDSGINWIMEATKL